MMKSIARRGFLKVLGVAPAAASAVADHIGKHLVSTAGVKLGAAGRLAQYGVPIAGKPDTFSTVADWFQKHGEKRARELAQYIEAIDPDLIEMRLPMATKARIQRERNYARTKDDMMSNMAHRLSVAGIIEWWN